MLTHLLQANAASAIDEQAAEAYAADHAKRRLCGKALRVWGEDHQAHAGHAAKARQLLLRLMHGHQVES